MVTLFSSLSLVNVRLLNDGLFVVLFSSGAIVEAFPLHYIWYSVSLLSLAYFFFFFPLLYWRTWDLSFPTGQPCSSSFRQILENF